MVDVVVVVVEVMVVAVAARHPLIASPSRSTHVPTPVSSVLIGRPSFEPFVDQK